MTYSFIKAAETPVVAVLLLMVLNKSEEHLKANSKASIQHRPAALLGALKMQWEVSNFTMG